MICVFQNSHEVNQKTPASGIALLNKYSAELCYNAAYENIDTNDIYDQHKTICVSKTKSSLLRINYFVS